MYQRDYIMRMIEMIADLIAGILGLIKKGDFGKASQAIENVYLDMLKQDAAFFSRIPLEDLTGKLLGEHSYDNGHLEILSELFYAQAELSVAQGDLPEGRQFYEKSLSLLEYLTKESKIFSFENLSKISLIQNRIAQLSE